MKKDSQNQSQANNQLHPAIDEHLAMGGSTFDARGNNLSGKNLWAVGALPEGAHHSDKPITHEEYIDFGMLHQDVLQHPNAAIGTSHDPMSGLHTMEVVATSPSKHAALNLATNLGEDHIYHLGTGQKVPTDYEGDRPVVPHSIDRRFDDLRQSSPVKQPFQGVHYSDAKPDFIDGNRRGSSGSGAESGRVRLGSQTGMGKDAPPGFYAYSSDGIADPSHAARKSAVPVRGNFSFADIATDPQFHKAHQEASATAMDQGADPKTASALGMNAGEHALRDAGYDGYTSSKHPGSHFLFGSYGMN